jgi:hypothetical protein
LLKATRLARAEYLRSAAVAFPWPALKMPAH